jgi:hypothetical protein
MTEPVTRLRMATVYLAHDLRHDRSDVWIVDTREM